MPYFYAEGRDAAGEERLVTTVKTARRQACPQFVHAVTGEDYRIVYGAPLNLATQELCESLDSVGNSGSLLRSKADFGWIVEDLLRQGREMMWERIRGNAMDIIAEHTPRNLYFESRDANNIVSEILVDPNCTRVELPRKATFCIIAALVHEGGQHLLQDHRGN